MKTLSFIFFSLASCSYAMEAGDMIQYARPQTHVSHPAEVYIPGQWPTIINIPEAILDHIANFLDLETDKEFEARLRKDRLPDGERSRLLPLPLVTDYGTITYEPEDPADDNPQSPYIFCFTDKQKQSKTLATIKGLDRTWGEIAPYAYSHNNRYFTCVEFTPLKHGIKATHLIVYDIWSDTLIKQQRGDIEGTLPNKLAVTHDGTLAWIACSSSFLPHVEDGLRILPLEDLTHNKVSERCSAASEDIIMIDFNKQKDIIGEINNYNKFFIRTIDSKTFPSSRRKCKSKYLKNYNFRPTAIFDEEKFNFKVYCTMKGICQNLALNAKVDDTVARGQRACNQDRK